MSKILLLRASQDQNKPDKYKEIFSAAGLEVVSISPIGFEFFNLQELYESVKQPSGYSGIIFSSPRTVQSVKQCIEENSSLQDWFSSFQEDWTKLPAFCVGESTSSEARHLGFQTFGDNCGNGENLVKLICENIQPKQAPLLFPCGTLRRDVIPNSLTENGIAFSPHTVYKTCPDAHLKENLQTFLNENGLPQVVTFFSPSGVMFSQSVLKELNLLPSSDNQHFVAIGSTTEKAMKEHNINISGTAEKPSPESLLETIKIVLT